MIQKILIRNFLKITISVGIMALILSLSLDKFANYLEYDYNLKLIFLIIIVGFVGIVYLLSCYLLGVLKIKNYKLVR